MALHVDGLRLWHGQEGNVTGSGHVNVISPPEFESDETVLSSFERSQERTYSGMASGIRISNQSGYPSDPIEALAQWTSEFESLLHVGQGTGYSITDDERGTSTTEVVTDLQWMRNLERNPLVVRWSVTLNRAEGLFSTGTRSVESTSTASSSTLDGNDLGKVTETRTTKSIEIEEHLISLPDSPEDNSIIPEGGVTRQIDITGEKIGSQSSRNTWENNIRALLSLTDPIVYSSGFPGRSLDVMVDEFDDTRPSGSTKITEYALSVIEGQE